MTNAGEIYEPTPTLRIVEDVSEAPETAPSPVIESEVRDQLGKRGVWLAPHQWD